ncbi:MAG: pilus assembly protein PilN [Moraxellaceae bacterium]|nr:MAG: pilus assembly protein PilN [Moraxellaceae bacterium]
MTRINLLPWREERRQELKRQFFVILAGVAIIGAGGVYLADMTVQSQIRHQSGRNAFVTAETQKLENQIKEIKELQNKRESLVERMNVIQNLQGNRPVIVHVFEDLARTAPDGVYYNGISASGGGLTIEGYAEANNRVSNLMRNLNKSEMFRNPNLSSVRNASGDGLEDWSEFSLTIQYGVEPTDEEG